MLFNPIHLLEVCMYMYLHFEIQWLNEYILKIPIMMSSLLYRYFIQRQVHLHLPGIFIVLNFKKKLTKETMYICVSFIVNLQISFHKLLYIVKKNYFK